MTFSLRAAGRALGASTGIGSGVGAAGGGGKPPLGDLTPAEIEAIQAVVNQAGRPLEVVGSAARGARKGVGTNLPIGKDPGTRSDIDYLVPLGSVKYYKGLKGVFQA